MNYIVLLITLFIVKFLIAKKNERNFYNPEEITTIAGLTYTAIDYKDYKKLMDTKTSFMLVIGQEQCSACNRYSEALKQVRKDYGIRMYYLNYDKYAKECYLFINFIKWGISIGWLTFKRKKN